MFDAESREMYGGVLPSSFEREKTHRSKFLLLTLIPTLSFLLYCIYYSQPPSSNEKIYQQPLDFQVNVFNGGDTRHTANDKDGNIMFLDRHNIDCGPIEEEALTGKYQSLSLTLTLTLTLTLNFSF